MTVLGIWVTIAVPQTTRAATPYDIGVPTVMDVWIDPVNGSDSNSGSTRTQALRSLTEAWNHIPRGVTLTVGYRLNLVAGDYTDLPIYWESRYGTYQFPILLQSADGVGAARLHGFVNVFDTRYLYFLDLTFLNAGDVFHCERCDYLLIRGSVLDGGNRQAHETIKINQSQHIYIESSDVSDSFENAIDFVAVQHGHIINNKLHDADDWCIYLKGGSAYFRVEANEIYNCGTGGFTAGQGTGFEFMVSPWLHYEAYDIKFVNNLIHDTEGAGIGVNGGFNILMAYNTLYRVGSRSHVIEVVFGGRTCDGNTAQCNANRLAGGWGGAIIGGDEPIPNRNIYIYNNIVYNPSGYQSQWQHFAIYGPRVPSAGTNIPSPARTDTNLQIRGNILWNGPLSHLLGIEDPSQGCQPSNTTCNTSQLIAENAINTIQPQLMNPTAGDFRPVSGGNVFSATTYAIPNFNWSDAPSPPTVPSGNLDNAVTTDRNGATRSSTSPPGAYTGVPAPSTTLFRVDRQTGNIFADRAYYCGRIGSSGPVPPCFNAGFGADIAERIDITETVEPGDLIEPDPTQPKRFRRTRSAYSSLAIGVIATAPAFVLDDGPQRSLASNEIALSSEHSFLGMRLSQGPVSNLPISTNHISRLVPQDRATLALIGRVLVQSSIENGPIQIGDLLVSASTPGYVMRCAEVTHCEGAIVGKALEALQEEQGLIQMLIAR
jgi:hypothetical protein